MAWQPTCILCDHPGATGLWQLCPTCRAGLIRRSAERQAAMAPVYCMACYQPRRQPPVAGELYCPRCQQRFQRG